ncbi:MAG: hypothetical protein ABEJ76_04700 [Halanaeroarchaeum sp.]
MAAVPPPSDSDDDPEAIAFGIAALDDRLRAAEITFPARGERVVEVLDDPAIPVDPNGRTMRLSEAIERADRTRFENRRDLLNALHPIFEDQRGRGGGVRAFLRRILPI